MRTGRVAQLSASFTGRIGAREGDWLAFAATLVLSVPALARTGSSGRLAVSLLILPFATVPLLWRRRAPTAVLGVLLGALVVSALVSKAGLSNIGVLFGLYAAAAYGDDRLRALTGLTVGLASAVALGVLVVDDASGFPPHVARVTVFGAGLAWLLGLAARNHREAVTQLRDRASLLEREREEHAQRAAERERIRIARELHDIVTHRVTAIAVQAGAAHSTSQDRPARALETLGVIERTARTTLGELRTLLGVLRAGDGYETVGAQASLRPRPSLAALDELVADTRAAGSAVAVQVCGQPVELDPVIDLSAYRVLQEALTNVTKHAPGATASVLIDYRPDELHVTVSDDGQRAVGPQSTGYGLTGMRERVQLAGGQLHAGPATDRSRGFEVRAQFPR
jgi:signal transduction histidine kinase